MSAACTSRRFGLSILSCMVLCIMTRPALCTRRYYTPAILELAGIHDKRTALLVALAPAAVNALGTVAGMLCIDRCGRRWAFFFRAKWGFFLFNSCACYR